MFHKASRIGGRECVIGVAGENEEKKDDAEAKNRLSKETARPQPLNQREKLTLPEAKPEKAGHPQKKASQNRCARLKLSHPPRMEIRALGCP
jgi:hypothetical protein